MSSRLTGACWLALALLAGAAGLPRRTGELASFSTPLDGRSPNQVVNARLAAAALQGVEIPPHGEFGFNRTVGPWTRSRGYKPAPVSYGGEMVIADGGGVCQVSTTLYNAALLAGLTILERDQHLWAPHYVPPGRDAAVAQGIADLRLQNPHPEPVVIAADAGGDRLTIRLLSRHRPSVHWRIECEPLASVNGAPLVRFERGTPDGVRRTVRAGRPGCRVRVWRLTVRDDRVVGRELVSDDSYLPLAAVTHVGG